MLWQPPLRDWEVTVDDLQLKAVKEKKNLPLKVVSAFSSRSRYTASLPSSSSSSKSSTVRNNFFEIFRKNIYFVYKIKKPMVNDEISSVDARQRFSVVMRPREETVSLIALGVPAPFLLHNLRVLV